MVPEPTDDPEPDEETDDEPDEEPDDEPDDEIDDESEPGTLYFGSNSRRAPSGTRSRPPGGRDARRARQGRDRLLGKGHPSTSWPA
jgi:hypothetical protein